MRYILILSILAYGLFLGSCTVDNSTDNKSEKADSTTTDTLMQTDMLPADSATQVREGENKTEAERAKASRYICPNSCPEGKLNKGDNCPACGMELIENPDFGE